MLYFFFLRTTTGSDCAALINNNTYEAECNTCNDEGPGTPGVVESSREGENCHGTGTCEDGYCISGK